MTFRHNKYGAIKTNGYASRKEANRAAELRLLEMTGVIGPVSRQVAYDLLPAAPGLGYKRPLRYVADFHYVDKTQNKEIIEDVKGFRTPVYKLKKRLMAQLLGIEVQEV